jgi:two-component system, sensor histidine kinase and response regulator
MKPTAPSAPAALHSSGTLFQRGLQAAVLLLGTLALVLVSLLLARGYDAALLVWLPNALVFAVLVRTPVWRWPELVLAAALACLGGRLIVGEGLALGVLLTLADVVEVLLGAWLIRHWALPDGQPFSIRTLLPILLIYPFLAVPPAVLIGAEALHQSLQLSRVTLWGLLWLAHVLGFVLLALPALLLTRRELQRLAHWTRLADFLFTLAVLVTVTYVLMRHVPVPFIYVCALFAAIAYRDGPLRTLIHADLVLLILGGLWWGGQIDLDNLLANVGARGIWAATVLSCLFPALLGLAVEDLRRQQQAVSDLTRRLRLASSALRLGIWDWHLGSGKLDWDERMFQLYDLPPDGEPLQVAQWRTRVHPDDLSRAESELQAALAGEREFNTEYRLLRPDGSLRHIRAAGALLLEDGQRRFVGVNWDVTPEREALQAVRDAQARLNGVIDAASEFSIIATSPDGIIEVFSEGAERLLGYAAHELVGRSSPALLHVAEEVAARGAELSAEFGRPIHGFDVFVEKVRQGGSEAREWTYVRKDGSRFPVKLVVTAIRDDQQRISGFLGVAQDISAQRKAQQALLTTNRVLEHQITVAQRARLEFENLFELAPGAVLVVDKQGDITKANSQAHDLFGYAQGDLVGRSIEELIPREKRSAHVAHRADFMLSPSPRLMAAERVLAGLKKNGEQFLAEITLSPLLLGGAPCTIAIVRDVSRQKQTEQALARAKEDAETASRAKSEFLANMSHEIRTPLNAILGAAQLLENLRLGEEARRYLQMIRSSGTSLLGVINDVLDFSKIEAGRMELAHELFDLDDLLGSLANLMSINAGSKDIELAIGISPDTPARWLGDPLRLNQVLVNLVGNAIKFTDQGEVVVQVSLRGRDEGQGRLHFSVRDTGIGMTVEQQQRLFQAFSQADTSMTRRFGGSGLGLVICQRLIRMMGGEIQVRSLAGVGTEFSFEVALDIAPEQPPPRLPASATPCRVLVVDDNPSSQQILVGLIRQWGWQADVESSCEDARQRLRDGHYDAVLVDWRLPCRDQLHGGDSLPNCRRILLLSAFGRQQEGLHPEYWDSQLIKPITPSALFEALQPGQPGQQPLRSPAGAVAGTPLAGVRVLLVEDNELNQAVACGLLEQAGAQVDVVANGRQAVDWLRARANRYALVLMDVQMPVMDGFTATRLIREELQLDLPVIAMSAGVMLAEQQQCLASGMNGFIAKPIDYPRMIDTLLTHLPPRAEPVPARTPAPFAANGQDAPDTLFAPDNLLRFVRGKPRRLRDILDMIKALAEGGNAPIEKGRQLLAHGDPATAARHFHTLKGSLGNLGARRLWPVLQALETALRQQPVPDLEPLLLQAEGILADTCAAASAWLQAHPELQAEAGGELLPPPPKAAALTHLRHLLQEQDIQACDAFACLLPDLRQQLSAPEVAALEQAMQALDFPRVLALLPPSVASP